MKGHPWRVKKRLVLICLVVVSCFVTVGLPLRSQLYPVHATEVSSSQVVEVSSSQVVHVASPQTFLDQGIEYFQTERFAEAIESWQQALNGYVSAADRLHQGLVLSNLSLAYQHLGQWSAAETVLNQSFVIYEQQDVRSRSATDWNYYAKALNTQGWFYWRRGQPQLALEAWQQATSAYAAADDFSGLIGSQINQAKALQALGLSVAAQDKLADIQQLIQTQENLELRVLMLQSLGNALRQVGKLDESQIALEQSFTIATQASSDPLPNPHLAVQSSILLDLGNTERFQWERAVALNLNEANRYQTAALNHYQQAAQIAPSVLLQARAKANRMSLLADVYSVTSSDHEITDENAIAVLLEQLLQQWQQLQADFNQLPLSRSAIDIQLNSIYSLLKLQAISPISLLDLDASLNQILQQARQLKDSRSEALVLGQQGHLFELTQQWHDAKRLTEQAIALAETIQAPDIRYRWEWQLGRIFKQQHKTEAAIRTFDQAVATLAEVRQDLLFIDSDIQFSFRDDVEPLYRQFVDLLLSESIVATDTLKKVTELMDSLQLAELENYLGCNIDPIRLGDIVVDPTAAIIYPVILEDRLEVILQMPDQTLNHVSVPISKSDITTLTSRLYLNLPIPNRWRQVQQDAGQLYQLLIQPLAVSLQPDLAATIYRPIKTLIFVLDGTLRNVPMSVLWDNSRQQYLLEQYAIAVAPSLQVVEPQPLTRPIRVLTAGSSEPLNHPFRTTNFSPLQNVQQELDAIQSLVSADVLLNEAFTKANLEQALRRNNFSIVHLASHGVFSSDPAHTFIALSDQPVFANELDNLLRSRNSNKRPIELLVLSACQTATGDDRATLGLAGLTVRAGARSTLATLWSVDDASAAQLMELFYQQLAQHAEVSRAEALRQAQIRLWEVGVQNQQDWKRPYFWSPYILVGNWL